MAYKVENPKGFKVINTTAVECLKWGGFGVCDHCNQSSNEGRFIAVLNHWVCPECFDKLLKRAVVYEEDKPYETKVFNRYAKLLGLPIE